MSAKKIRWLSLLLFAAALLALPALAAGNTYETASLQEREDLIYRFLTEELGLDRPAACGVLGNMYCESSLDPTASCVDVNGKISYGLCQWNGGRYQALQDYCAPRGLDYRSTEGQLAFLRYELENSEKGALAAICALGDNAEGAYQAGYNWAVSFERCSSRYYAQRGQQSCRYWLRYCGNEQVRILYFDAAGGSGAPAVKAVTAGMPLGPLPTPRREGQTFLGWYTQTGTAVTAESPASFSGVQILCARWSSVEDFVRRLYAVCLHREADAGGLAAWSGQLTHGGMSGSQAAAGFFSSQEYLSLEQSDREFLAALYQALLGREADEAGLLTWLSHLESERSRCWVFSRFCGSPEFQALCSSYGISGGCIGENDYFMGDSQGLPGGAGEAQLRAFVEHLYTACLERVGDEAGIAHWTQLLARRGWSAGAVAEQFVFSAEYTLRETDANGFVTMLYRTLLGREPDAAGLAGWTGMLASGADRRQVFSGFVSSGEFRTLCAEYGITHSV